MTRTSLNTADAHRVPERFRTTTVSTTVAELHGSWDVMVRPFSSRTLIRYCR